MMYNTKFSTKWYMVVILMVSLLNSFTASAQNNDSDFNSEDYINGVRKWEEKDYVSAESFLKNEVKNNAQNGFAWYYLGKIQLADGDFRTADDAFEQAVLFLPWEAYGIKSDAYCSWGCCKMKENEWGQAGTYFDNAVIISYDSMEDEYITNALAMRLFYYFASVQNHEFAYEDILQMMQNDILKLHEKTNNPLFWGDWFDEVLQKVLLSEATADLYKAYDMLYVTMMDKYDMPCAKAIRLAWGRNTGEVNAVAETEEISEAEKTPIAETETIAEEVSEAETPIVETETIAEEVSEAETPIAETETIVEEVSEAESPIAETETIAEEMSEAEVLPVVVADLNNGAEEEISEDKNQPFEDHFESEEVRRNETEENSISDHHKTKSIPSYSIPFTYVDNGMKIMCKINGKEYVAYYEPSQLGITISLGLVKFMKKFDKLHVDDSQLKDGGTVFFPQISFGKYKLDSHKAKVKIIEKTIIVGRDVFTKAGTVVLNMEKQTIEIYTNK